MNDRSFSQLLDRYIEKSGLTEAQLAKISGFTRSYIALMKNGSRTSPDTVKVKKLLESLQLSHFEYSELWEAYLEARDGEVFYALRKRIISFLEGFNQSSGKGMRSQVHYEIPDREALFNRVEVESFLKAVIENEASKKNGHIQLVLQEDFSFLFHLLPSLFLTNESLLVEHIICLEKGNSPDKKAQFHNLKILEQLLPVYMTGKSEQYKVYYYYDNISSHFSSMTLMPYLVITGDYAVAISYDFTCAFLSKSEAVREMCGQRFAEICHSCHKMFKKISESDRLFYPYTIQSFETDEIYTIGSQPYFGALPVERLMKPYLTDSPFYQMLTETERKMKHRGKNGFGITSYFTKEGIIQFMENGILDGFPRESCFYLRPEDRKILLELLIRYINLGYCYRLTDNQKIRYPSELIIIAYGFDKANMIYKSESREFCFAIKEQSTIQSIYEFLSTLKSSTYIFTKGDTLEFLKEVYQSY